MALQNGSLTICPDFPRPDANLVKSFDGAATGPICDAQGRRGALNYQIKPLTCTRCFVGPALVVDAGPRDNLAPWVALKYARPGDILLIATGEYKDCSVIGDVFAGIAKNAGVAAIVTDGMVRDVSGINATGLPVFAAGISPNSPWKSGPGSVGLEAVIGGVAVRSGDLVLGDPDGVVVVPRAQIDAIRSQLDAVLAKEAKMATAVSSGATLPDWLAATFETLDVTFIK